MLGTTGQCKTAASAVSDILHVEEKKNLEKQRKNSLNSSLIPVSVRVRAKYEGKNGVNEGNDLNGGENNSVASKNEEKEECKVDIKSGAQKNNTNSNTKNGDENNTQNNNENNEKDEQSTLPSDTIFLEMLRSMSEMLNIGEGRKEREL